MSFGDLIHNKSIVSLYIKTIYNQQQVKNPKISNAFKDIQSYQLLIIKLLNLSINRFPIQFASSPSIQYEDKRYQISSLMRNIGYITRSLGEYVKFQSQTQSKLSQFQTTQFYKQIKIIMPYFIHHLIGIFPKTNTDKQNMPLYMPLYQSLQNYSSFGNTKWEMSRMLLNKVYHQEILGSRDKINQQSRSNQQKQNQVQQDLWYLMLIGDKKIIQIYKNKSILQRIWSLMYCYYIQSTLKPYKIMTTQEDQNIIINDQMTFINQIKKVIQQQLQKQNYYEDKLILYVILDILTQSGNNYQYFDQSWNQFQKIFQNKLNRINDNDKFDDQLKKQKQQINLSIYGLINAQFSQLNRNQKQTLLIHKYDNIVQNNMEMFDNIHKKSLQFNKILLLKNIIFGDYYLRIMLPSRQPNSGIPSQYQQSIQQNQQRIVTIFKQLISSQEYPSTNPYPMFTYQNYSAQLYQTLSQEYFSQYPSLLTSVIQYLPKQKLIFTLLQTKCLNNYDDFIKIKKHVLQFNNFNLYMRIVNDKYNKSMVKRQDLIRFFQLWDKYHRFVKSHVAIKVQGYEYVNKIKACIDYMQQLKQQRSKIQSTQFYQHTLTPFKDHLNRINLINIVLSCILSFISSFQNQQYTNQFNKICLSLNQQWFSLQYLSVLNEEQKINFCKSYSNVLLNQENTVKKIIRNQNSQDQSIISRENVQFCYQDRHPQRQQDHIQMINQRNQLIKAFNQPMELE